MAEVYQPREYAVFRRMDGNIIPGMTPRNLLLVVAALALGALVFLGLGHITHGVEEDMGYEELCASQQHYEEMLAALQWEEADEDTRATTDMEALRTYELGDYGEEEVASLAEEARAAGMDAWMGKPAAVAMAPTTTVVQKPLIPMMWRLMVALLPAVAVVVWKFDSKGISIEREVMQMRKWKGSQKLYFHSGS